MGQVAKLVAVLLAAVMPLGCTTTGEARGEPLDAGQWRSAKSELYHRLALQYLRAGDHSRARRLLEQAVQFDNSDERSLELLTRLAYGEGDLVAAGRFARLLLDRQPRSVAAMCTIGAIAEADARYGDAEASYRAAIATEGNDPRPRVDLHRLFLNRGDELAAGRVRMELDARFPGQIEALLDNGAYLASTGRWSEATGAYRQALDARPRSAEAAARYAFSALVSERFTDVWDLGERMAPHARLGNSGVAMALAAVRTKEGDFDGALQELDLLDESDASHADVLTLRGELLHRVGRTDEACAAFESALNLDPTQARAHAGLGRAHLRDGRYHAASRSLRKSLQFDGKNGVLHALLAAALASQGDSHSARVHLDRARDVPGATRLVAKMDAMFPDLAAPEASTEGR